MPSETVERKIVKRVLLLVLLLAAFFTGLCVGRYLYRPEPTVSEVPVLDRDYYASALSLIKNAEHSVHLLMFELFYYPEYQGSKTNTLLNELANAHSRGVEVKVCVEGGEDYLGEAFFKKQFRGCEYLDERGVEMRVDPEDVTTHAKLLIADRRTVLLGSTNWSYYAMEKNSETNILIESPSIASSFDKYFNRVWGSSSPLNSERSLDESRSSESQSPIAELLSDPDSWDEKRVTMSGEVVNLKKKQSRSGNLYSTFFLSDKEGNRVKVFKWGHPAIDNGKQIEVEGVFRKEKHVGKLTFYNEIDAESITQR